MAGSSDDGRAKLIVEEEESSGQEMSDVSESLETKRKPRPKWARGHREESHPSVTSFRTKRSCKASCGYVVCTVMMVLIAIVLSVSVGLFVGQSLGRRAVRNNNDTQSPCNSGGGGSASMAPDWGDTVTIDGSARKVSDYFIENVKSNDIRSYLS